MDADSFKFSPPKKKLDSVAGDLLGHIRINRGFLAWMTFLMFILAICLFAYTRQLREGLIVTGLRDYVSWGVYIANFVFFVATSLVGMLIGSVLGLLGQKWITPIARIAEIIAVAFAAVAGLVIISDMGRPDRLPYLFLYGRIQSPILWDVTVVTTYFVISLLLWFLPMLPDLEIGKTRLTGAPPILAKAYDLLSFKWIHSDLQYKTLFRMIRILMILVIPTAFAIHTVTSWLFAVTPRAGWDSTIFGPYFLSGAFVAGTAAVVIALFFFMKNYKLEKYITEMHFDKLGKLLVLVSIIYLYFNLNEFLVPAYKLKKFDLFHLHELFSGKYAPLFWFTQLTGLLLPIVLLLFRKMRKPLPLTIISVFVVVASWLKRYLIVVPSQEHPFLPVQHVPAEWMLYRPTVEEIAITVGSLTLVIIIITVLSKFFPVIPIWETVSEDEEKK